MKLMTKEILDRIPPLYSQEKVKDPIVHVKFFTPWSSWSWYCLEYDPDKRLFFGLVEGHETELGYFSLDELESVRGPVGLKIERDMYFDPKPLSYVQTGREHERYDMPKRARATKKRKTGRRTRRSSPAGLGGTR